MPETQPNPALTVRPAVLADAKAMTAIDAQHTSVAKPQHWQKLLEAAGDTDVALVAVLGDEVVGFVVGETRAWEFGSPPTGWVYAVGVSPEVQQSGVGRQLVTAVLDEFNNRGVASVRTMVRREDVTLLRFFRTAGFTAGPFVELEVECE